jgi:hypothetical protein
LWHDSYVLVVLVLAAATVIAGVTVVAMGRGGELTEFAPDIPPLDLPEAGQLSAVDFVVLQLPVSLVGYHTQSVDETLNRVANALSERDTRIAVLEQRVSELLSSRLQARQEIHASPLNGPRTEHEPEEPERLKELSELEPPEASESSPEPPYRIPAESPSEAQPESPSGSPSEPTSEPTSESMSDPEAEVPSGSSPGSPTGSFGAWTSGERSGKEESR